MIDWMFEVRGQFSQDGLRTNIKSDLSRWQTNLEEEMKYLKTAADACLDGKDASAEPYKTVAALRAKVDEIAAEFKAGIPECANANAMWVDLRGLTFDEIHKFLGHYNEALEKCSGCIRRNVSCTFKSLNELAAALTDRLPGAADADAVKAQLKAIRDFQAELLAASETLSASIQEYMESNIKYLKFLDMHIENEFNVKVDVTRKG